MSTAVVAVDAVGFASAAEAFATANGVAAQIHQEMTRSLDRFGAMAGDDATSEEFAAGYDIAAADTIGALGDLVAALAALARITATSGAHHRAANAASVYSGYSGYSAYSASPPAYVGDLDDALPATTVTVGAYGPPPAAGGEALGAPYLWDLVVDHLEGWTWPGADTATLRTAAGAWRQLGSMLRHALTPYLHTAVAHLEAQRSPEVAIAVGVTRDLQLEVEQLAVHCEDLGRACEEYAAQVEAVRAVVAGIVEDLAIEVGVTVVIGGVVSALSLGSASTAGVAVAGWRLTAAARRIVHAFTAMKAAVGAASVARLSALAAHVPVLRRRFQLIASATNRAHHERYLHELRAAMAKPHTEDPRLSAFMSEMYRDSATVGSGSTAAAVRHELITGLPTNGTFHSTKAVHAIGFLQKWLRSHPHASHGDRAAAENVIRDLQDALGGR